MVNTLACVFDVEYAPAPITTGGDTYKEIRSWIDNNDITATMFEVWGIRDSETDGIEGCDSERSVDKFQAENIVRFESKNAILGSDNTWLRKKVTDIDPSSRSDSRTENDVKNRRPEVDIGNHDKRLDIDFTEQSDDKFKSIRKKRYYTYQKEGIDLCNMGNSVSEVFYHIQTDTNADNQDSVIKYRISESEIEDENRKETIVRMLEDVAVEDDDKDEEAVIVLENGMTDCELFEDVVFVVDFVEHGADHETEDSSCTPANDDNKDDNTIFVGDNKDDNTIFVGDNEDDNAILVGDNKEDNTLFVSGNEPEDECQDADYENEDFNESDNDNLTQQTINDSGINDHPNDTGVEEKSDDASNDRSSKENNNSNAQEKSHNYGLDKSDDMLDKSDATGTSDESADSCDDNVKEDCTDDGNQKEAKDSDEDFFLGVCHYKAKSLRRDKENMNRKEKVRVDESEPTYNEEAPFERRDVVVKKDRWVTDLYAVDSVLGRGKFGEVKRCRERRTGRQLAAKFIEVSGPQDRTDVINELEIMKHLQHPRLLQLYDAFENRDKFCLVLELVCGGELFERVINDDFILTEKACMMFMRQICDGVAFMHSESILHLDMKPENILCLTREGNRIKIIDFGLARKFSPKDDLRVLFGTPEFVAPEVVNFDPICPATDMWSVGVICYVLLSGLSPFMGDTEAETLSNVTMARWDFNAEEFENISPEAKDFITKLLVKNPRQRMSAADCLEHQWLRRSVKRESGLPQRSLSKKRLRKFVYRRKWQKAINAMLALRRMGVSLC